MLQKISRGDVYFYNFGFDFDGSIEGKNRPCVIVSNNKGNTFGTTALVAPITTRTKDSCKPWQVHYYHGDKSQVILCEQIKTVNISKLYSYQGRLDALTMRAVDEALAIEFDLNVTQKEQNSTEFLHRLDYALDKMIAKRIAAFENKFNENMEASLIPKVTEIISNYISSSYELISQNTENIDKILKELHAGNNSFMKVGPSMLIDTDIDFKTNIKQDVVKTNKPKRKYVKYSLEEAKQMVSDYYELDRTEFMSKYNLSSTSMLNSRLATMRQVLKRNGIDYKNIRDKVTVYNIRDLSEEEQRSNFSRYLKGIKSLNEEKCVKSVSSVNKSKQPGERQPKINYENVDELLSFIEECNNNTVSYICDKYGLTKKQLSNRKYLITQSLKKRQIPFTMIKKSRKDV